MPRSEPRPVLVVGGGPFQLDLIAAVRGRGLRAVVVDRDPAAPGLVAADLPERCDIIDVEAVIAVARRHGVGAVVSSASDAAMPAVSAVARALGLPGQPPEVIATCRDKQATFDAVHQAGLAAPPTRPVADVAAAEAAVPAVGSYPVVVKPRSAAGGRGVSIVRSFSELGPAFARAEAAGRGSGVLVQGFVGGESVGVEALFWQGRLLDAFVLVDTYREGFVSPVGHALPCPWPAERQAAIVAAAARFAAACGLVHGAANFDLRDTSGHTTLIEINPRPGGSNITELVRLCYGVDLSEVVLSLALGEDPAPRLVRDPPRPAASRLLISRGHGPLHIPDHLHALGAGSREVHRVRLTARDGAPAAMRVDDWGLLGDCLTTGDTVEAALERAEGLALTVEQHVHVRRLAPA